MKNLALTFLLATLSIASFAANFENVAISYGPASVTLSAINASWKYRLGGFSIYRCSSNESCDEHYADVRNTNATVTINELGRFRVWFKRQLSETATSGLSDKNTGSGRPSGPTSNVLFVQDVVNLQSVSDGTLRNAIKKYAPVFSFAPGERYFPVFVADLFDQTMDKFDVRLAVQSAFNPATTLASSFMRVNAHKNNVLLMKTEVAQKIFGSRDSFPLYWFAEQVGADEALVTYFLLYSYDEKIPWNSAQDSTFDHELDRESIVIRFKKGSDQWRPVELIFSAHADYQTLRFFGCAASAAGQSNCDRPTGAALARWNTGKARVNWANASRRGNNPIVYVSRGTHAMNPALGWYRVTSYVGAVDQHWERAGESVHGEDLARPVVTELNLSDSAMSALVFSGVTIQAIRQARVASYRLLPFERYPAKNYIEGASAAIDDCVKLSTGCGGYVYRFPERWKVVILPPAGPNDLIERATGCAINADGTVVGYVDTQQQYGAAFWLSATGDYSLKIPKALPGVPRYFVDGCLFNGFAAASDTGLQIRLGYNEFDDARPDYYSNLTFARKLLDGLLGVDSAYGRDVSDSGIVVGSTNDSALFYSNNQKGVPLVWIDGGPPIVLPVELPGRTDDAATSINSRGVVVGVADLEGSMWMPPYTAAPIRLKLDGFRLYPRKITNGDIVGGAAESLNDGRRIRPFIWEKGIATILPVPADTSSDSVSQVMGINIHGDAVGGIRFPKAPHLNHSDRSLFWRQGQLVDLIDRSNFTQVGLTHPSGAYSINDDWFIAGSATLDGVRRSIVWVPD